MPVSSTHTGWRRDDENSRLDYYYEGTRIGHIDADGFTVASGTVTVPAGTIGAADIADASLTGDQVAVVADDNTEGGIPVVYRIDIAAVGATSLAANTDVVLVDKIRVIDVMAVKTGGSSAGGSENISVLSTGAAITDVMSWTGIDKLVVRPTSMDDAQMTITAGGILRVTVDTSITDETSDTGYVVVTAMKVA